MNGKTNRPGILSFLANFAGAIRSVFTGGGKSQQDYAAGDYPAGGTDSMSVIAACKKVVAADPNDAEAYFYMGDAYDALGRYAEAISAFEKAVAVDPGFADAYSSMAISLGCLNRYADAINACEKAIAIDPDHNAAYNNLAVVHGHLGQYEETISACRKAIDIDPDDQSPYNNMGRAYYELGRFQEALEACRTAIAIDPDHADPYVSIGVTYEAMEEYRADAVANGIEAIESLSRQDYDLVLMDCQMPEMDGYQAAQSIRDPNSSVRNHNVPIIAMTANAMKGDREKCLAAGMNDYVAKPVDVRNLAEAIERNLANPREWDSRDAS